jgi:hypothetical protein
VTRDKFQVFGDSLTGHGLSFEVTAFGASRDKISQLDALVDAAEVVFKQGRESALLSFDDRFDLSCAVDALRALSIIVGPTPAAERYRRAADAIARLLQAQEAGA